MKPLILIGGGGHCKSVIDVAESAGYSILGILDRDKPAGTRILDYEVLGADEDIADYIDKAEFLITVGQIKSPDIRKRLQKMVLDAGGTLATVVSPTANVSKYATLGKGTVVMHQAVVNADVVIGEGCIINTFANIEHDVVTGDFCHISTGAMVNGEAKVGSDSFVGSQSVVCQCVEICDNVVIGAGSVVTKNISKSGLFVGNPAEFVR